MKHLNLSDDLVFYTIEGEGEYVGKPSVFMRLSGCNLTCKGFASEGSPHGCDSFISWSVKNKFTFQQLNDFMVNRYMIQHLQHGAILKITGGEPLIQQVALEEWLKEFLIRFEFIPRIDFETNGTIKPRDFWIKAGATFTVSPKMSNNGDPEKNRYKPKVLQWHNEHGSCFKFVIKTQDDIDELFEKYISNNLIKRERVWLMPCCGNREEHNKASALVAELCKYNYFNFSPRLQLVIWDQALKV